MRTMRKNVCIRSKNTIGRHFGRCLPMDDYVVIERITALCCRGQRNPSLMTSRIHLSNFLAHLFFPDFTHIDSSQECLSLFCN